MKQFAIAFAAILATSVYAQRGQDEEAERPFMLKLVYENADSAYLGLEVDNPVTLILPKVFGGRGSDCTGWQLDDNSIEYDDFWINEVEREVGNRGKIITTYQFTGESASGAEADVLFNNTCSEVDDNGNYAEQLSVRVVVA